MASTIRFISRRARAASSAEGAVIAVSGATKREPRSADALVSDDLKHPGAQSRGGAESPIFGNKTIRASWAASSASSGVSKGCGQSAARVRGFRYKHRDRRGSPF